MSKLTRVLALGALLAATNLASSTAVAHATNHPAAIQDGRRPPTERQVGEAWRHRGVTADQPRVAGNPQRPPLERQVGEAWRHHVTAARPAEPSGAARLAHPGDWCAGRAGALQRAGRDDHRRARRRVRARPAA